jgi:hypothetical protein
VIVPILTFAAGLAWATPRYVDLNCPTPISPYLYWTNAANTISAAVTVATSGDTIWVTNGLYSVTTQINVTADIAIRSVTGPSNTLVARTDNIITTRIFYVNSPGAVLDGLTISNGLANGHGGGVYLNAGLLTNCFIVSNSVTSGTALNHNKGGGVYMANGRITDCSFSYNGQLTDVSGGALAMITGMVARCVIGPANNAEWGGGLFLWSGSVLDTQILGNRCWNWACGVFMTGVSTLEGCVVASNTAGSGTGHGVVMDLNGGRDFAIRNCRMYSNNGMGLYVAQVYASGTPTVEGWIETCDIRSNAAGGISVTSGADILTRNCRVIGNNGCGIFLNGTNLTARNCEVLGHSIYGSGGVTVAGGIHGIGAILENCTVVANYSYGHISLNATNSGGVLLQGGTLANSIVISNVSGRTTSPGLRLHDVVLFDGATASYSCSSTDLVHGVSGCITNSPQFLVWPVGYGTSATTGNLHLAKESPCINTGTNAAWMYASLDLDGNRRFRGSRVDMGAYEYPVYGTLLALR